MSFLLDTDTCSAAMRGHRGINNRLIQYGGRVHMSAVTLGELYVWALRIKAPPKRMHELLDLLAVVQILPVDELAGRRFGELRAWQSDRGLIGPDFDSLHASVALVHNLTLVTHNTSDYKNVPGLALADWLVP